MPIGATDLPPLASKAVPKPPASFSNGGNVLAVSDRGKRAAFQLMPNFVVGR